MSFATNLQATSVQLLVKYGNAVTLIKSVKDTVYNPAIAGGYAIVNTTYSDKAYIKAPTTAELEYSGIDSSLWNKVSGIATIAYKSEYSNITNDWTINGKKVQKVIKTEAQDTPIVLKVYF